MRTDSEPEGIPAEMPLAAIKIEGRCGKRPRR